MINILPKEKKELIEKERARRFFLILGLSLFIFLILSIIVLLPPFLYLTEQKKEIKRTIKILESGPIFKEIQEIENKILGLNQKLVSFNNNQSVILDLSLFIEKILEQKPQSLKIQLISFEHLTKVPRISLQGESPSRDLLLEFVKDLNEEKLIEKVHSPITNILREKDIEFNLTIEFK